MDDAAVTLLPYGETAALEDREHRAVLTEHVGLEMLDA
jgi:hypothetical protein